MKPANLLHRNAERGMTLVETLVAVAVFTIVFISALMLYQAANRAYLATDAATIQQQNSRFAFDQMTETLRNAGADYNETGATNLPDEQIEGAWESAVIVRGDFDNARETALQNGTHPVVSTGNDEIVAYVLTKAGANNRTISVKADLSTASGRDAVLAGTTITGEETRNIAVAARTLAEQTNPPYQLSRVTFDASGNPQYQVIAENVFRLSFGYRNGAGTLIAAPGFDDAERAVRAAVRRIGVRLITMADRRDFEYRDPNTYTPAEGPGTRHNRKFTMEENVLAVNLGMKGRRHVFAPAMTLAAPQSITVCTGHCNWYRISWPASTTTGVTQYQLRVTASSPAVDQVITVTGLEYRFMQPDTTPRDFTFQVAAMSGGSVGAYGAAAVKAAWHDTANSIPSPPANITGVQAGTEYAMALNWDPVVTNTGTITDTNACTTFSTSSGTL